MLRSIRLINIPRSFRADSKISEKLAPNSNPQNPKFPSEFTAYDDTPIDPKNLPPDVIRRVKNISSLHLLERSTAEEFASKIIPDLLTQKDIFVAELNSGPGLLTKLLLDAGVTLVHSYEKYTEFKQWLDPLVLNNPGRLDVRSYNLLQMAKTDYIDRQTNSKNLKKNLEGLKAKLWTESAAIAIVGAIPDIKFLYALQWSLIHQFLSNYGRVVVYGAISPSMSSAFEDDPRLKHFHTSKNVFIRTFFNFTKLGSVPRSAFFPWEPEKIWRKKCAQYYTKDKEVMDIVKIEAKKDFFTIHMRKKSTRVIPTFEKWVTDCGPRLIKEDFNIYTTFDELNSSQLLHLFKVFKSWPEYETSPFLNLVETLIQNKEPEE